MGRLRGFDVECTNDGRVFEGDLGGYDAIAFYTSGDLTRPAPDGSAPMSPAGKQRLLEAIGYLELGMIHHVRGCLIDVGDPAALAPAATFAALWPPTLITAVPAWLPVTSPPSNPVKLLAVVALPALPAFGA